MERDCTSSSDFLAALLKHWKALLFRPANIWNLTIRENISSYWSYFSNKAHVKKDFTRFFTNECFKSNAHILTLPASLITSGTAATNRYIKWVEKKWEQLKNGISEIKQFVLQVGRGTLPGSECCFMWIWINAILLSLILSRNTWYPSLIHLTQEKAFTLIIYISSQRMLLIIT